jgi:hypothetical protein
MLQLVSNAREQMAQAYAERAVLTSPSVKRGLFIQFCLGGAVRSVETLMLVLQTAYDHAVEQDQKLRDELRSSQEGTP